MDEKRWLRRYLEQYREALIRQDVSDQLLELKGLLRSTQAQGKKVVVAGNGGSAAIASHCAVDLTKSAGIRAVTFNEADLITCFANDYGYEWWVQKALECYADAGDLAVLISSSGKSPNMLNAARYALDRGLKVVTFSGFAEDNALRALGHVNFWVNSRSYNVVEMTHHIWLLAACDLIAGLSAEPAAEEEEEGYAINR